MTTAFYPGSFDPMTNGHLDVLVQALNVAEGHRCDRHPSRQGAAVFLRGACRADPRRRSPSACRRRAGDISVVSFDNLVVDAARKHGATLLIRGLRDGTDLDYEMQMAGMNRQMAPDVQTMFLPAGTASRPITATLVRQIAAMGGDVSAFVPAAVLQALQAQNANPERVHSSATELIMKLFHLAFAGVACPRVLRGQRLCPAD